MAKPPLLSLGEETFKAVKEYKTSYDEAILLNSTFSASLGHEYNNRISIMRHGLPSTDWIPPVLAWYRKFKINGLLRLVKRLDNKFSADWILQLTPTQRIQNMNDVLKIIEQAKIPNDVLNAPVFLYDRDQLIASLDGAIYGRRFAKYTLLRLENLNWDQLPSDLNLPDELSVEHIMPQNPAEKSQWVNDFKGEQERWLHRLGNLMLLSRRKITR